VLPVVVLLLLLLAAGGSCCLGIWGPACLLPAAAVSAGVWGVGIVGIV
jgi:hypothetical protein